MFGSKEIHKVFDDENRLQKILDVEAALARAHAEVGNIPKKAAEEISKKASTKYVRPEEVRNIKKRIQHGIMAIIQALSNVCEKDAGGYVHLGASSNDIADTALALQLREAIGIMLKDLGELEGLLLSLAEKHKETMMVGRTHGQHALPTTLGLKFAVFASEIRRSICRIEDCKKRLLAGKMAGAVGTQAAFGDKGLEIQKVVMKRLGLKGVAVSSQVIQRDRHAEFIADLGILAGTLEKIGKEIRNLQRTEIGEVEEPFREGQMGSSTMPHKRNPIKAEQVCGLARVVRSNVLPALENIALEHEADLTSLVYERLVIPETCLLVDEMLKSLNYVLKGLKIHPERMEQNLAATGGLIMSEAVMMGLVKKGVGRQEAYDIVRRCTVEASEGRRPFKDVLLANKVIRRLLSEEEIEKLLDPKRYLGTAVEQVEKLVRRRR